jgi:hypothetical protein
MAPLPKDTGKGFRTQKLAVLGGGVCCTRFGKLGSVTAIPISLSLSQSSSQSQVFVEMKLKIKKTNKK